jgi:coproporphyrinogen III oxidase-like Fe-S oxidoreductase
MAQNQVKTMIKVPHSTVFDHEKVKNQLGQVSEAFGSFMEMAKFLQSQEMNYAKADAFIKQLVSPDYQIKEFELDKNRTVKALHALFGGGALGSGMVGYTKWGMLNAVTEYYDHHIPNRSNDTRLNNAWFGSGDRAKNKAVELLLA